MDLNKSLEYFNPDDFPQPVNIIGCGAVGSQLAVLLARLGVKDFVLWDTDTVSTHNIANQNFTFYDVGKPKTDCVSRTILSINPEASVQIRNEFWTAETYPTGGCIITCVDSIAARKEICKSLTWHAKYIPVFDFRMGLTSGQFLAILYDYDWWMSVSNFTDEEADMYTPKSACNFELSVAYSIWALLGYGVSTMVKYFTSKDAQIPKLTVVDMSGGITTI